MSGRLRVLSGLGAKAAACFLVEAPEARIVLDLGAVHGPDGNPDLGGVGPVDAVVLSHLHPDHAAGLSRLSEIGTPPVHATALTARGLGRNDLGPLPMRGETEICGVRVTTGRNGHAPGGVWLHLALGDGLLFCGDIGFDSAVWPYDPPPPAATVVLDASFADEQSSAKAPRESLAAALEAVCRSEGGPLLLPAPAWGRGLELAFEADRLGAPIALDAAHREALATVCAEPDALCLSAGAALPRIAAAAVRAEAAAWQPGLVVLIGDATARSVLTADWIARIEARGGAIRFTGHCPPESRAARLVAEGRAGRLPWSVHPWLWQNRSLLARTRARAAMPAFCARRAYPALAAEFAPVRLLTEAHVQL